LTLSSTTLLKLKGFFSCSIFLLKVKLPASSQDLAQGGGPLQAINDPVYYDILRNPLPL
jgi:hypothetical protein